MTRLGDVSAQRDQHVAFGAGTAGQRLPEPVDVDRDAGLDTGPAGRRSLDVSFGLAPADPGVFEVLGGAHSANDRRTARPLGNPRQVSW